MQREWSHAVIGFEQHFTCRHCRFESVAAIAGSGEADGGDLHAADLATDEARAATANMVNFALCPQCGRRNQEVPPAKRDFVGLAITLAVMAVLGAGLTLIRFGPGLHVAGGALGAALFGFMGWLLPRGKRAEARVLSANELADRREGRVSCVKCLERVDTKHSYIGDNGSVCESCFQLG